MGKAATLLGLTLCVISLTGAAIAQKNNSTSSLETPARFDARVIHPNVPASEVETLRRRVEEVEEQHCALAVLLKELKSKLESAQPADVASNSQVPKTTVLAGGTPAAPSSSKQNDSGNVRWADLIGEGNRFKLYGFVRLDVIFDSWAEANINISRYLSINPGISTDDPVDEDIFAGGRTRNGAFFIANRITPGGNFVFGADYLRWRTDFKGFHRGINNRVNIFFQYNF